MQSVKSVLASYLTLSSIMSGPCMNDKILFPNIKSVRNVPEYARKNEQGRNDKCNCGSGLKYKKCCGK
jgi:hypothetical protein